MGNTNITPRPNINHVVHHIVNHNDPNLDANQVAQNINTIVTQVNPQVTDITAPISNSGTPQRTDTLIQSNHTDFNQYLHLNILFVA